MQKKEEGSNSAVYLSSEKLDSVGMLQPKGRSQGSEHKWELFSHFQKQRAVTSQKPLQVPARAFSGGSTLPSCNYMVGLRPPVAHRLWASTEMRAPVFRIVVKVEVVHGLLPLGELLSLQEFCSPSPKENILFICIQSSGSSGSDSTNWQRWMTQRSSSIVNK